VHKSVKAISIHPAFRIITALPLALLILIMAELSGKFVTKFMFGKTSGHSFESMAMYLPFLALVSLLFSYLLSGRKMGDHGYQKAKISEISKVLLPVLTFELLLSIPMMIFPLTGEAHFAEEWAFWQDVVGIWILASTAEELLCRGVIQSYLAPAKKFKIRFLTVNLSVPVFISAFIFMLMHVPLIFFSDMDKILYSTILASTFTLGLVAGYFREKTGSLLPAIVAHSFSNITGSAIGSLISFMQ